MSNFLKSLAHNPRVSLGPKDTRQLADVISTEKRLVEATHRLAAERSKASAALKEWGASEGPDLNDVLTKCSMLFEYLSTAEKAYAEHDESYRLHFKSIRTREENLAQLRRTKDSLASKIESQDKKVSKMKEENKDLPVAMQRLAEMRQEMIGLENSLLSEEAIVSDAKRSITREALALKSGALLQLAEKTVVVAEITKLLVDEIPSDRTEPGHTRAQYEGYERTDELMSQAQRCIQDVVFNPAPLHDQYGPESGQEGQEYHPQAQRNNQQHDDRAYEPDPYHGHAYGQDGAYDSSYAVAHQQQPDRDYGDSSQHQYMGQPHLPEINHTAPLALPAGAGRAGGPELDSIVDGDGHRGDLPTPSLAPPNPYNDAVNRSSLAYMDDGAARNAWAQQVQSPSHRQDYAEEDTVLARERAQAEQMEHEELERRRQAKEASMNQRSSGQQYEYQPLLRSSAAPKGEASPIHTPPRTSLDQPAAPASSNCQPPQRSSLEAQEPTSEAGSAGIPYSPPSQKHNNTFSAATGSAIGHNSSAAPAQDGGLASRLPPPVLSVDPTHAHPVDPVQSGPLSSPAFASPNAPQPSPSRFEPQSKPRQPVMIRGESALGSKYGDVFVANRAAIDGGNLNSTNAPLPSPSGISGGPNAGAHTGGAVSSGYFRPGDNVSQTSAEPRRVNAGAFRRAPQGPSSLIDGSPRYGNTSAGPSQAEAIRDQYRKMSPELEAPPSDGPRFDTTPLQVNKGRAGPQRAGTLPSTTDQQHGGLYTSQTAVPAPPLYQPEEDTSAGFAQQQFVTRLD